MTKPSSKSNPYTRFIPREEVGDVTRWHFGAVGASESVETPELPATVEVTSQEMQEAQEAALQQARDQAFAEGHAQGSEQMALEWQRKLDDYVAGQGAAAARQLAALAAAFENGLTTAQQRMAQEVLGLVCDVARQVLRRELRGDTAALQPVIAEALGMLVADARPIAVRLHADDALALGPALKAEFSGTPIQWISDAEVSPGGCLVEQAGAVIDGQLEKRWQRAIAPLGLDAPWHQEAGDAAG